MGEVAVLAVRKLSGILSNGVGEASDVTWVAASTSDCGCSCLCRNLCSLEPRLFLLRLDIFVLSLRGHVVVVINTSYKYWNVSNSAFVPWPHPFFAHGNDLLRNDEGASGNHTIPVVDTVRSTAGLTDAADRRP